MSVLDYVRRMRAMRQAFRQCFFGADGKPTPQGELVLAELRRFCHGNRPTLKSGINGIDPYASVAAAARQEVFFRITAMLELNDSDINRMQELAARQQGDDVYG